MSCVLLRLVYSRSPRLEFSPNTRSSAFMRLRRAARLNRLGRISERLAQSRGWGRNQGSLEESFARESAAQVSEKREASGVVLACERLRCCRRCVSEVVAWSTKKARGVRCTMWWASLLASTEKACRAHAMTSEASELTPSQTRRHRLGRSSAPSRKNRIRRRSPPTGWQAPQCRDESHTRCHMDRSRVVVLLRWVCLPLS